MNWGIPADHFDKLDSKEQFHHLMDYAVVKPASIGDAHEQAIAQFYDPALTATESWGNTANIKAFKESSIFSSLPGKTASNKYYNWHNMVSKAYKANQ